MNTNTPIHSQSSLPGKRQRSILAMNQFMSRSTKILQRKRISTTLINKTIILTNIPPLNTTTTTMSLLINLITIALSPIRGWERLQLNIFPN